MGVEKPARYIGGELGRAAPRARARARVAWLLIYPDTYEIGLPNQGLQILYEILNERPDALAERTYAPWVDMEAAMRGAGVPALLGGEPPAGRGPSTCWPSTSRPSSSTPTCSTWSTWPGWPCARPTAAAADPLVVAGRPLRLQPRAAGRLRRRLRAGRRRGGGGRDERGGRPLAGPGPRRPARPTGRPRGAGPGRRGLRPRPLRAPLRRAAGWWPPSRTGTRPRRRWRSAPWPTWPSGPTPAASWSR